MAEAEKATKKAASRSGFTAEERAAMNDRAQENRRARTASKSDGTADLLAKIAEMPTHDRELAERLHALVTDVAPELTCRTWYGMPAYAKDGDVVCFFQSAAKFKSRYATLGFSDKAALDDGAIWPTYFALAEWTPAVEKQLRALVAKAFG
ncbi:MAG TPA: DUF1801 domain-containing protein [Jatrophihabitans sp.]|jgi:hypothetical protein